MKRWYILTCLALGLFGFSSNATAVIVDFETELVPLGTLFGEYHGQTPGSTILTTSDGIILTLDVFSYGATEDFFQAEVGGRYSEYFDSTPLELDNISIQFDLTPLPFDATSVTFEYLEFGGGSNLSVNAGPLFQMESLAHLPTFVAPGVTAFVMGNRVTLTSQLPFVIEQFLVGGQELAIDSVMVVPEPATVILVGLLSSVLLRRSSRRHA